ncbi:hypothetical protein [Sphingosinicella sp.]|uniref:hypothetical protein n=1 Tax=Sphingosinicella sp. TaxID=1917971 RepID=UPI004037CFEE
MSDEVRKVSRRSFLGRVLGGAAIGAIAIVGGATPAEAQVCTDRDPTDPGGRGRWCRRRPRCTDRDPSDPVGRGRWCTRRRRRRSGITDRDPGDPVGRGRGRRRTGITDSDPSDPVGNGRG